MDAAKALIASLEDEEDDAEYEEEGDCKEEQDEENFCMMCAEVTDEAFGDSDDKPDNKEGYQDDSVPKSGGSNQDDDSKDDSNYQDEDESDDESTYQDMDKDNVSEENTETPTVDVSTETMTNLAGTAIMHRSERPVRPKYKFVGDTFCMDSWDRR